MLAGGRAWTLDTLIEGVHFDERLSPADVGWKAVAVSVSDLAAMGAAPTDLLLGLSVRSDGDAAFVEGVAHGVAAACHRFELRLIGGDTTRARGPRTLTSAVGGQCVAAPLLRSNAQVGDDLWVTGTLGEAGRGWSTPHPSSDELDALRRPVPPLEFALALALAGLANSAMDLSDGLASDLPRLCAASSVGARVDEGLLPGSADLRCQVQGGDDYQLLFSAAKACRVAISSLADAHEVRVTRIGAVVEGREARLTGCAWPAPLFQHFTSMP